MGWMINDLKEEFRWKYSRILSSNLFFIYYLLLVLKVNLLRID